MCDTREFTCNLSLATRNCVALLNSSNEPPTRLDEKVAHGNDWSITVSPLISILRSFSMKLHLRPIREFMSHDR